MYLMFRSLLEHFHLCRKRQLFPISPAMALFYLTKYWPKIEPYSVLRKLVLLLPNHVSDNYTVCVIIQIIQCMLELKKIQKYILKNNTLKCKLHNCMLISPFKSVLECQETVNMYSFIIILEFFNPYVQDLKYITLHTILIFFYKRRQEWFTDSQMNL